MSTRARVVIVGGGFTGLTAAYKLSQDERFSVTLLEAGQELGGLAGGFRMLGTSLEKTYHHIFQTDNHILELAEELGLSKELMWRDSSLGVYLGGRTYPFTTALDLLRFKPCGLLGRLRLGLVALYLKHKSDWRALASEPAHRWMLRACGPAAMATVWTPLLKAKFGLYYESVSMAWLWGRIHIRAHSRGKGGRGEKLGYFRGGFATVVRRLQDELARRGCGIETGKRVERFAVAGVQASARPRVCSPPFRVSGFVTAPDTLKGGLQTLDKLKLELQLVGGETIPFDYCIFTGSCPALARLLPPGGEFAEYGRQLRAINYLGAVCLVFASEQDLGDYYWLNINEPNAPFLVFINHTRFIDRSHYQGKHVYYIGAYLPEDDPLFTMEDDALTKLWFDYLRRMFPEFEPARVLERHLFHFKAAQHIADTRYLEKIPAYRTPLPGVFLANFAQVFPEERATNFAVREGLKIALTLSKSVK
jgi:protoporphyrinogen oxidase